MPGAPLLHGARAGCHRGVRSCCATPAERCRQRPSVRRPGPRRREGVAHRHAVNAALVFGVFAVAATVSRLLLGCFDMYFDWRMAALGFPLTVAWTHIPPGQNAKVTQQFRASGDAEELLAATSRGSNFTPDDGEGPGGAGYVPPPQHPLQEAASKREASEEDATGKDALGGGISPLDRSSQELESVVSSELCLSPTPRSNSDDHADSPYDRAAFKREGIWNENNEEVEESDNDDDDDFVILHYTSGIMRIFPPEYDEWSVRLALPPMRPKPSIGAARSFVSACDHKYIAVIGNVRRIPPIF